MNIEQEKMLKDVHTAIVGDLDYGHLGLVRRTEKLETKFKNAEKKALLIGAAGGGALVGIKGLLFKLFSWL